MVCKRCGYQNSTGAKYCAGCGRKLRQSGETNRQTWFALALCVLIVFISLSVWIFRADKDDNNVRGKVNSENAVDEQSITRDIRQVLPIEDGTVAVLYADGTVRTSESSQFSEVVQDWKDVKQINYNKVLDWRDGEWYDESSLVGLTESGSVLATDGSLSGWSNVKELHFTWQGVVGVTQEGRVLAEGDWEDVSFLTNLSNVETLVYSSIEDIWGCLKKDGSVTFHGDYVDPNEIRWKNVKELRNSGHSFYVIKKDGTVDGGVAEDQSGLNGAVKVVDYEDWLFGISADGRLLTHNGGNIYTNTGDMMVEVPESPYYGGEVDISQFDQVKDIVTCCGLIMLNEDGTAEHIGEYPHWDLHNWRDVQKVCACDSGENSTNLYGISQDGSVIMNQYDWSMDTQTVTEQYRGWKLQDIYAGNEGVVGLTIDGKLVGDGIYEYVDFSVFDR